MNGGARPALLEGVPFQVGRDPVSQPVIRRWCDAMGCRNPVHTDPVVAGRSRFAGLVAPLSMLDVWTKPGLAYRRSTADPLGATFEALDRGGLTSSVAVGAELTQLRPLRIGETIRSTITVESVSGPKVTALGPAQFVTSRQDFFADDAPVGHGRLTVMKFRPGGERRRAEGASHPPVPDSVEGVVDRDPLGTVRAGTLRASVAMPLRSVPVTATQIVAGALMTSDFFPGHHDRDAAVQLGLRDVFMNIHTTFGLIERCIGEWLGPNVLWRSISGRLGVPNYPGDVMTVGGHVRSVDLSSGATSLEFRAVNRLGDHAVGSAAVELPI